MLRASRSDLPVGRLISRAEHRGRRHTTPGVGVTSPTPERKKLVRRAQRGYIRPRPNRPTVTDHPVRIRRDKEDPSWQPRNGGAVRPALLAISLHAPTHEDSRLRASESTGAAARPHPGRRAQASKAGAPSIHGQSPPRASGRGRSAGAGGISTASGHTARRAIASCIARTAPRRSPLRRSLHTRLPGGSARRWGALLAGGKGAVLARRPSIFPSSLRAPQARSTRL